MTTKTPLIKKITSILVLLSVFLLLCSCSDTKQIKTNPETDNKATGLFEENESNSNEYVTSHKLEVHFIDVGQGDAVLAVCDDEAMLVDGGNSAASDLLYTYLKQKNIDHLKYVICTHPDEDHVGGLAGALNYAKTDHAYCSETEYDSRAFDSFLKYLGEQGVTLEIPETGMTLSLGSAAATIIGPVAKRVGTNNNSIVIKLQLGDISFLLTGDAEDIEENEMIEEGGLESTVLKVGHHGSNNSSSDAFLNAVKPQYAIISCGQYNEYGHPADGLLHRLQDHQVQIYRTDMQGDIICTTDGGNISVEVEHDPETDTFLTYYDLYGEKKPVVTDRKNLPGASQSQETEREYVLNTRSKKFHLPDCDSVNKMTDNNKQIFTGMREEVIEMGYEPCGNCHP